MRFHGNHAGATERLPDQGAEPSSGDDDIWHIWYIEARETSRESSSMFFLIFESACFIFFSNSITCLSCLMEGLLNPVAPGCSLLRACSKTAKMEHSI